MASMPAAIHNINAIPSNMEVRPRFPAAAKPLFAGSIPARASRRSILMAIIAQPTRRSKSGRRPAFFYSALALFAFALVDAWLFVTHRQHLAFTTPAAAIVAAEFLLLMPLGAAIAGVPIARRSVRIGVATILWVLGVVLLALQVVTARPVARTAGGIPATAISTGKYELAVYQFHGVTSEGGGAVDQLCHLLPGLVLTRQLYARANRPDVMVHVETADRVRIDESEVSLRPLGWPTCR
jgi:hypothetical protein